MSHQVYILQSETLGKHYIGYTSDIDVRLEFHKNSEARKFTYNADDWKLILIIPCESKTQALQIEKHIKSMKSKKYIENLILYPEMSQKLLDRFQL